MAHISPSRKLFIQVVKSAKHWGLIADFSDWWRLSFRMTDSNHCRSCHLVSRCCQVSETNWAWFEASAKSGNWRATTKVASDRNIADLTTTTADIVSDTFNLTLYAAILLNLTRLIYIILVPVRLIATFASTATRSRGRRRETVMVWPLVWPRSSVS